MLCDIACYADTLGASDLDLHPALKPLATAELWQYAEKMYNSDKMSHFYK